jgi:hypothetical protein
MGCGDDSDDSGVSGTGGGGAGGKAGAGGKSGSGGGAGKAGASGGSADPAACIKQTGDLMKGLASGGLSAECISCICEQNAKAVVACDNNASCWTLISCVADKCTGSADQITCAGAMCKDTFATGAGAATPLGPILQGNACAAKCVPAEGDAGVDAGN